MLHVTVSIMQVTSMHRRFERWGGHVQVSAGYDAHWRDPLASLQMRSSTYYRLAGRIKALADRLAGAHAMHACTGLLG